MPPTDKPVELTGVNIFQLKDGKIKEAWWYYDRFNLFEQLGFVSDITNLQPEPA